MRVVPFNAELPVRVIHGFDAVTPALAGGVLTIGNFDGVHLGHRHILQTCAGLRSGKDAPVVAVTFEPHPLTIVAPQRAPRRLTALDEKLHQLGRGGADVAVVGHSDRQLLSMEADEFARGILVDRFRPGHIVVGGDFGFGRGRRGNVDTLRTLAAEFGFGVTVAEPLYIEIDGARQVVSSSLIRSLLAAGKVETAGQGLGRPFLLCGTVTRGDSRGAGLGFPTANLAVEPDLIVPGEGVYSGFARLASGRRRAAISVGHVPTFDGRESRVEAFLLDYSGDLYGQPVGLEFHRFLREQRKFGSPAELVAQIERDVAQVRELPHAD